MLEHKTKAELVRYISTLVTLNAALRSRCSVLEGQLVIQQMQRRRAATDFVVEV